MSANESRSPDTLYVSAEANADRAREPGESLIERIMVRLGLKSPPSIRHDLEDALEESAAEGEFSPSERAMLKNVLGLRLKQVDDVMVPRADIIAVSADISLGELLRQFRLAGHSRLPVYEETLDDPKGMIHIRDFLDYIAIQAEPAGALAQSETDASAPDLGKVNLTAPLSGASILREVLFVPPSMPALDLLLKMQSTRTHMALVVDEFGGTDGLVTIEDLIETIVGDIEDEHDFDEGPTILATPDGRILADGRASLEEVSRRLGLDLAADELAEEVDTLGGLIATLAGRVPARGEIIAGPAGLEFEVLEADPRRIKRLRIHRLGAAGSPRAAPDAQEAASAAIDANGSDKADPLARAPRSEVARPDSPEPEPPLEASEARDRAPARS